MNRLDRISLFETLKKRLYEFSKDDIENGIMIYCLGKLQKSYTDYKQKILFWWRIFLENMAY